MTRKSVGFIAGLSLALLTRAGAQAVAVPDATIEFTVGVQAPVDAQSVGVAL
jgi:hypothetical protein